MGELAGELGVGKRSKRSSTQCRDPPVVVQASGLTRVSLPLEQHLPEEQSVIWADEVDTIVDAQTGVADLTSEPVLSCRPGKELVELVGETAGWATLYSQPQVEETNEYYNVNEKEGGDEGESSEGAGEELAAVVLLMEGGTKAPLMAEPSANAGAVGQEAPASVDMVVLPREALMDPEK
ncbi:uncharacterized protein A4U43_C06F12390 [Asparagus officinalis]|uniref:Uncharacterized protein n=1 Tax=Asparagus officinalis TaxID=4686 RepID=A0A5P1EM11_ASPOF|nr:uncharacterized protein A4U43_C06F12390 [Asparagus officinalis]